MHIFSKLELLKETKGGGKEEENDRVKNIEIYHLCVGTREKTMLKTIEQRRKRLKKCNSRG
jgi:hypothetical protein